MRTKLKPDKWLTAYNLGVVLAVLSLAVTVVSVYIALYTRREMRRLNQELHSQDQAAVTEALEELRARGWLYGYQMAAVRLFGADLQGADLSGANLQGVNLGVKYRQEATQGQVMRAPAANLRGADLSGANLRGTNLRGADLGGANLQGAIMQKAQLLEANLQEARGLTDPQLSQAARLWGTTMPDGSRYDGRYKLRGDKDQALSEGLDTHEPVAMAAFYEVPLEDYQRGQEWAEENLKTARAQGKSEAGEAATRVEPGVIGVLVSVVFSAVTAVLLLRALPGFSKDAPPEPTA